MLLISVVTIKIIYALQHKNYEVYIFVPACALSKESSLSFVLYGVKIPYS